LDGSSFGFVFCRPPSSPRSPSFPGALPPPPPPSPPVDPIGCCPFPFQKSFQRGSLWIFFRNSGFLAGGTSFPPFFHLPGGELSAHAALFAFFFPLLTLFFPVPLLFFWNGPPFVWVLPAHPLPRTLFSHSALQNQSNNLPLLFPILILEIPIVPPQVLPQIPFPTGKRILSPATTVPQEVSLTEKKDVVLGLPPPPISTLMRKKLKEQVLIFHTQAFSIFFFCGPLHLNSSENRTFLRQPYSAHILAARFAPCPQRPLAFFFLWAFCRDGFFSRHFFFPV